MTAGDPRRGGPPVPPLPPAGAAPPAPRPPLQRPPVPGAAGDPGELLAVIGLVLAFVCSVAGIVVSAVARSRSRAAGYDGGLATAGLAVSVALTVVQALVVAAVVVVLVAVGVVGALRSDGECVVSTDHGWHVTCTREDRPALAP